MVFGFTLQLQSYVMVPLIQVSTDSATQTNYGTDLDDVQELALQRDEVYFRINILRVAV